jgi:transcriptional regulator with XRE-family HTH domain
MMPRGKKKPSGSGAKTVRRLRMTRGVTENPGAVEAGVTRQAISWITHDPS